MESGLVRRCVAADSPLDPTGDTYIKEIAMKVLSRVLTLTLCLAPITAIAQVNDSIELTREVLQTERKAIVAASMEMTEEQSKAFWPVYNDYRQDMRGVGDRLVKVITGYAENYKTLTDEQAKEMLDDYLEIQEQQLKVRKSYVKKFGKVLPAKKVTRFYQVEDKIEALIMVNLAQEIPLVR